jgi:hypothetical protein
MALAPSVTLSGVVAAILAMLDSEYAGARAHGNGHCNALATIVGGCVGIDVLGSFRGVVGGEGSTGVRAVFGHIDACSFLLARAIYGSSYSYHRLWGMSSWDL